MTRFVVGEDRSQSTLLPERWMNIWARTIRSGGLSARKREIHGWLSHGSEYDSTMKRSIRNTAKPSFLS